MKERAAMMATAFVFLSGINADARDPFENESPRLPIVERSADPAPFVVPAGLYYVTETYVGDVVATNGATTTYSTTTVHESTGTYARVVDVVDTGASSAFDGTSFNGRGALTDGRPLAGTYYENFVLTANGYVPVSIVFFQDDSESKRQAAARSPSPSPSASASPTAPGATLAPGTTPAPKDLTNAPRSVVTPGPAFKPNSPIAPTALRLRAGVALAPDGATLGSAEVLRGRLVYFWLRAFANDMAVPIRSWRLLSAHADRISAASGGGNDPLGAQWLQMPAPGVRWSLRFEVVPEFEPAERLEAEISVTVRSPALID
jgi:hypothetical protein